MGKKAPAAPPPPDPVKVAQAQTDSNLATARTNANMNRLDETDPMGSVKYTDLGGDRWRRDTALSPVGQEQFDLQNQVDAGTNRLALQGVGQAANVLGTPFSLDGIGAREQPGGLPNWGDVRRDVDMEGVGGLRRGFGEGAGGLRGGFAEGLGGLQGGFGDAGQIQRGVGPDDFSADRQRVEQAVMSRMQPQLDRGRAAMAQRLADQGIPAGSEAYGREMDALGRQENDAQQQAILAGGQEQSRMFGLDLNKGNFANQAQQQDYSQQMGRSGFANDAQQAAFGQEQARAGFANDVQQVAFGQDQARAGFENDAQRTAFDQASQRGQFANQATAQLINQRAADKADWAGLRQREIQEALLGRSQPINEIGALLGTGQVGMPQFQGPTAVNVQGTDVMGAYGANTAANQAQASQAQQAKNAQGASAAGMLGTVATGAMMVF